MRAFSRDVAGGNLAGVVLNSDGLSASEMTEIAGRVEASETAFLTLLDRGMTRIRWFSAASEVGFCIHATIAAVGVLRDLALVNTRPVALQSPRGVVHATLVRDKVFVRISSWTVAPAPVKAVTRRLGCDGACVVGRPKIVELLGEKELVVQLRTPQHLAALTPSASKYTQICRAAAVNGISVFAKAAERPNPRAQAREFAPLYGYLEDPVCGLAGAAIAGYLWRDSTTPRTLRIEQGMFTGTRGVVEARIEGGVIHVGGRYVVCGRQRVELRKCV